MRNEEVILYTTLSDELRLGSIHVMDYECRFGEETQEYFGGELSNVSHRFNAFLAYVIPAKIWIVKDFIPSMFE